MPKIFEEISLFCRKNYILCKIGTKIVLLDFRSVTTVAHNCHGKLKFIAANSNSPRQIQIHDSKFKFTTANSNSTPCNVSSVLWRPFSTLEAVQDIGGGDNISTVGDSFSTMEGIQYCGGTPSVL